MSFGAQKWIATRPSAMREVLGSINPRRIIFRSEEDKGDKGDEEKSKIPSL
jgi:hypothetical protein